MIVFLEGNRFAILRYASKVDNNQKQIVTALRKLGAVVLLTHQLKNCCDCIVYYRGNTYTVEIKDGKLPPSARKLTEGEQEFKAKIESVGCKYWVIESVEDAVSMLNSNTK
jgi:hypothetical protein